MEEDEKDAEDDEKEASRSDRMNKEGLARGNLPIKAYKDGEAIWIMKYRPKQNDNIWVPATIVRHQAGGLVIDVDGGGSVWLTNPERVRRR